ncbi:MAG TPA: M13 family metallopeptidase [Kofleriaceae bacterium]|nr:M13 family metallopeptidase [Kofleriaceae bacterium]
MPASGPQKPIHNTTLAAIGLDPDALDRTADPCEDFYQFACGNWLAKAQIAPDLPIAMRSFVDIELRNEEYLHDVLEKARANPGKDPLLEQLGAYYGACMDEASIEKAGLKPAAPVLAQIKRIKDPKSLSATVTMLQPLDMNPLFSFAPTEDYTDATKMIGEIDQGGLGLPDRDYYLKDDDASKGLRQTYVEYAAALLVETGHKADAAKREADEILALETELAKISKDKVARRDPKGLYNKIDRDGVKKAMPHFEWDAFLKAVGQPKLTDINVTSPDFLAGLDALIVKTPAATWRNYFTVHALGNMANMLPKKIVDIQFKLQQKLGGATEQRARWKRCVAATDGALGDALGQIYVRDRFPGESKSAAEAQVHAIVAAMKQNLDELPWMDATTKTKAYDKLGKMAYMIGYPTKWRSYSFKIGAKTYAANALAARRAEQARQMAKIGKPVDRRDWNITPPTVNAFYNPTHNKMVFPAGILQTPFYQVDHSIAVNLGGMGMVVGHELTHGFDDEGSQFDAVGNMTNWWQPETERQFKQRTQCVVDQYSSYDAGGGKLNGKLTLGENIADIGGIKLALAAYRQLRASAPETDVADGFTEDQQFFLSVGQTWCAKMRPELESMLVTVDPHSPPRWRVNGSVSATPDFAKAFRCKAGAKMRPAKQCVVW